MLATLPVVGRIGLVGWSKGVFDLIRTPIFIGNFSDGGQGPEKPIIEESKVEEEVFTFPYPEERGEISDIVNPPVEGIVGEVLRNKSEVIERSNVMASSDAMQYVFVGASDRRATSYNSQPEFVSLTRQPEIAGSYAGLLVYSNYGISNADFSYTSDQVYEGSSFTEKTVLYGLDKPFYEFKIPMPMISKKACYQAKDSGKVYVKPLTQPKSQPYQNVIQEEINLQPIANPVVDVRYNNVPESDFRLNLKSEYKALKLELPLVRTELPVLDLNIENNENNVAVPKYDIPIKYQTVNDVVGLPVNLGFDDTLLRDRFIEKLNSLVMVSEQHDIKLPMREPVQYNMKPLDFSLDNQLVLYSGNRVNLDPYALFSLRGSETQTAYSRNIDVRNILLPNTEYRARSNLDNLVKVNYDNRVQSLPRLTSNVYNPDFIDVGLQLVTENTSMTNAGYEGIASEQNLEDVVEQEKELTEEKIEGKPDENIEAEVYDDTITEEAIYEKSEMNEEQETETNESSDSSAGYLATAAGAVGLGILAGAGGIVGALLKKEHDESTASEPDEPTYKSEEIRTQKKCGDSSQCFADTIKWLEGKLESPILTEQEYESISQCYAEDIKNIQKARDYIKQREREKPCGGALYDRFHHVGFTEEQKEKYKLNDYVRDGEIQQGFKLVTTINVGDNLEGDYYIEAIWEDDIRGGELDKVKLMKNSAYAQLDIGLREQGYTPIWKIMSYIDTDTGEKRSGLYLETVAETHLEAKALLGDKDEYGMKLSGIILLVNGIEQGGGKVSMHDYNVKPEDIMEVIPKNDSALYSDNKPMEKISEPIPV